MSQDAIVVEHVSRRFGDVPAVADVSLKIASGTSCALLGANGAGKSTLINILCTLIRPDTGTALVAGIDVVKRPARARRSIGVLFQDSSLDDRLTAEENLDFHGLVYGVPGRERARRIEEVLDLVELMDWRDAIVRTFSGGMKRRLEIARALLHEPRILFLDEPSAGLDAQTRTRIWQYLGELQKRRDLTLLITTHYIEEVENCDQVAIMDGGRILADGTPDELKRKHGSQMLRLTPRDSATREEIVAFHPDAHDIGDGRMVIEAPSPHFVDDFLARFTRLSEIRVENPSLESVFLSITGRELRDRSASQHETDAAAGREGGRR